MVKRKTSTKGKDLPATQSKAKAAASQLKKQFLVEPLVLSHESIAARAYQIWESSGYPVKRELEHWVAAERELRGRRRA